MFQIKNKAQMFTFLIYLVRFCVITHLVRVIKKSSIVSVEIVLGFCLRKKLFREFSATISNDVLNV